MASTDAKHIPVKNSAYRLTFPIFDADGDLVAGATGLDSEVSIDGGTFADCTNEATEIATSSGMYYLDLTAAEMNGDTIALIIKTSSSGAKTTPIVLYTAARSVNDLAFPTTTGRSIDVSAGGEVGLDWANVGGSTTILNLSGTTIKTATDVDTQLGAIDDYLDTEIAAIKAKTDNLPASPAATGDIPTAATVADAIWDEARSGHTTAGTFGESFDGLEAGQAATGTLSTTQMTTNLTEATDDHYNGRIIVWLTGALKRQATDITDYTGSTKMLTFTAVTEAPANGDRFIIV